jgi:myo-inositol-1(or 4)-monophosphatase
MSNILAVGIEAAKEAGKFIMDNFGKIREVSSKGDRSLATDIDQKAEKLIINTIKKKFPAHGILAEESGKSGLSREYLWIIDPLDGTHNFIRDINIFGVSIGVVYKKEFIAGIIYIPLEKELYAAEKGSGAYKNNRKISVSSKDRLKDSSVSFDSSIRYSPKVMLKTLGALAKGAFNVRMFGSSARVLSYIAEGKLDGAIEFYDHPWDFAGGVCLIEEAGGKLTDLKGNPLTHKNIGYIASNSLIHNKLLKLISPCSRKSLIAR